MVDIAEAPEPSPARSLVQSLSIGILRAPVRVSARALWRLMLLSELGFRRGLREPIGLNILGSGQKRRVRNLEFTKLPPLMNVSAGSNHPVRSGTRARVMMLVGKCLSIAVNSNPQNWSSFTIRTMFQV